MPSRFQLLLLRLLLLQERAVSVSWPSPVGLTKVGIAYVYCSSCCRCLSERALRALHCLLFCIDRACTPGSCPPYPSATCRHQANRSNEILLLLQQQKQQQRNNSSSSSRRQTPRDNTQRASRGRDASNPISHATSGNGPPPLLTHLLEAP